MSAALAALASGALLLAPAGLVDPIDPLGLAPQDGRPEPEHPGDGARAAAALLAERCHRCHGPDKQKAGLRLDLPEGLLTVVTPGDPQASALLERVSLPAGHDDAMPPDGDPLAPDEVALLRHWIEAGASTGAARAEAAARAAAGAELERVAAATGGLVLPLDPGGDPRGPLRVELAYAERAPDAETLAALAPLAERIVELGLAGTAVAPGALVALPPLPALERAHLERTALGDADAAALVERAPNLRYLNLHSSAVTDRTVFERLVRLERLVLYATPASPAEAKSATPFGESGPRRILISDRAGARLALLRETSLGVFDVVWQHADAHPEPIAWIGNGRVRLLTDGHWTVDVATGEKQELAAIGREREAPPLEPAPFTASCQTDDGTRVAFEDRVLVERDARGQPVLAIDGTAADLDLALVRGLQRLASGNLILRMAEGPALVELDREGRVVWRLDDERFHGALVDARVLEDPHRWPEQPAEAEDEDR